MKQILEKPYVFLFSVLLFFTPLIVSSNTSDFFEFPKMYFVYILGLFIIAFYISDIVINPVKIKVPNMFVLMFLLITAVSTFFSSHFYTSFFGYYSRFSDGFLSYLIFFGLYFVAINKIDKEDFTKIIKLSLFSILPISIYGLAQHFGGPKILWSGGNVERVFSTIGQPNWLAQYLGSYLMICLFFLFTEDDGYKKWFFIYVFGFYCFWLTYSVSGILGYLAGLIFLSIYVLRLYKKNKAPKDLRIRLILVLTMSLFIVFSNLGMLKMKLEDAFTDAKKNVSVIKNVYAQGDSEYKLSDPGFIRLALWKSTLTLIKSSSKIFLIGSGPETFPYSYQPFRDEDLNYSSEWNFVFNKPHNYYLEILAESGISCLLVYFILIYQLLKNTPKYVVFASIVFFITNIFGWPVVSTSLIFWFFLASINFKDLNYSQ